MRTRVVVGWVAAVVAAAFAGGCGGGGEDSGFGMPGEDGQGGSGSGGSEEFGSDTSGGTSEQSCAASSVEAKGARVDLIFVIDSSGSMTEEMAQIRTNVNSFAQKIGSGGLDYTVLVITPRATSSTQTGNVICVPPPLGGASCADNAPLFHQVSMGVGSHSSLGLVEQTYSQWKSYLRTDAYKVFVEVTDDESQVTSDQFDQWATTQSDGMFGTATARRYIFDSIVGWQDGTPALSGTRCSTAVNVGSQYQKLSQLTQGLIDSVCKTDYSSTLDNLAKGIATRLGCEFQMPTGSGTATDPSKVEVRYTPTTGGAAQTLTHVTDETKCGQFADGWYYDDNANPQHIKLCQSTCGTVGASSSGKLDILVGCKAAPPK